MSGILITLLVLGGLALIIIFLVIGIYNNLVQLRNRFKNAFAQIDVQLKRRYDLIPNLVEMVKGYMKHESETLEAVVNARNRAVSAASNAADHPENPEAIKELSGAESALSGSLSRLFALAEAYPDLKANQNMSQLQEELATTENRIAFSRQAYNDAVMQYNTARETFPAVLFAGSMGFREAELLEIENPEERAAPKVSFT